MDVMRLIDRLESIISSGTRIPMSSRVMVDEQEFLDIVDQIRVAFPEELKQARKLSQERERMLNQAQVEADRLLNEAREQVAGLTANEEVVVLAKRQADGIVSQATTEAAEIRGDADGYAVNILLRLEDELVRLTAQARKGRAMMERVCQETAWSEQNATPSGNGHENLSDAGSMSRRS